jgi:hypothetical protein
MISSYRLGDLIFLSLNKNELLNDYPNSIGSSFIRIYYSNPNMNKMELIYSIINKELEKIFLQMILKIQQLFIFV